MKLRKNTIALAAAACTLLITNASQGAVVVTFSQVGANVVASWEGTLNPGVWIGDVYSIAFDPTIVAGRDTLFVLWDPNTGRLAHEIWGGGFAVDTGLLEYPDTSSTGAFGFNDSIFIFDGVVNDLDDSLVAFFPALHTITWNDRTLASIGAGSFDSSLAWTSSAGGDNTVRYTTVIPEPSAALLSGLGALYLLRRRK